MHLISSVFSSTDYVWITGASYILWVHRIVVILSLVTPTVAMKALMPLNNSVVEKKRHCTSNHMASCIIGLTSSSLWLDICYMVYATRADSLW